MDSSTGPGWCKTTGVSVALEAILLFGQWNVEAATVPPTGMAVSVALEAILLFGLNMGLNKIVTLELLVSVALEAILLFGPRL